MLAEETVAEKNNILAKLKDYGLLMKLRLSFLVVLSAVASYFFVGGSAGIELIYLIVGGFLITGASNGMNQIFERELDKKMDRTANRPIPAGRMTVSEAWIISISAGILGALFLFQLNYFSGILGVLALVMYVFIYTPFKRISPWAVFIGAFPGAIPPMLGAVAVTGHFDLVAGILFFVQFIWQFPHFWAIAWVLDEDYAKAGFSLLPSPTRKSKRSAQYILIYTLFMVPAGLAPWVVSLTGDLTLFFGTIAGIWFFTKAYQLYIRMDDKSARALMFASFIYLPVMQFLYVFDKI